MKKLFLMFGVLILSACSSLGFDSPNCYERVAISKISLTEAYKTAYKLSEEEVLSIAKAEVALTTLDQADSITDNASALCAIDEPAAVDYLTTAKNMVDDALTLLQKEVSNGS